MDEEKIKAVSTLFKEATQKINLMADALQCAAIAMKQSHELPLIGLQTVLQQKESEAPGADPKPGEKKESK